MTCSTSPFSVGQSGGDLETTHRGHFPSFHEEITATGHRLKCPAVHVIGHTSIEDQPRTIEYFDISPCRRMNGKSPADRRNELDSLQI
jgi:hypothetical protein